LALLGRPATGCRGRFPASGSGVGSFVGLRRRRVGRLPLALAGSGAGCSCGVGVFLGALARLQGHRRAQLWACACGSAWAWAPSSCWRQHPRCPPSAASDVLASVSTGRFCRGICLGFAGFRCGALGLSLRCGVVVRRLCRNVASPLRGVRFSASLSYRCQPVESVSLLSPVGRISPLALPTADADERRRRRLGFPRHRLSIVRPSLLFLRAIANYPWLGGPCFQPSASASCSNLGFHIIDLVHDRCIQPTPQCSSALQPRVAALNFSKPRNRADQAGSRLRWRTTCRYALRYGPICFTLLFIRKLAIPTGAVNQHLRANRLPGASSLDPERRIESTRGCRPVTPNQRPVCRGQAWQRLWSSASIMPDAKRWREHFPISPKAQIRPT